MTIHVTQEDIDDGKPLDPCACPIAIACNRQGFKSAVVNGRYVYDRRPGFDPDGPDIELPHEAALFTMLFDMGSKPAPFSFDIEPLTP